MTHDYFLSPSEMRDMIKGDPARVSIIWRMARWQAAHRGASTVRMNYGGLSSAVQPSDYDCPAFINLT